MHEGWNYSHDHRNQVSYASLIEGGKFVIELSDDGHDHERRIFGAVEDWELHRSLDAMSATAAEHVAILNKPIEEIV